MIARRLTFLIFGLWCLFASSGALAQTNEDGAAAKPDRMVVLNIPGGGGTEALLSEVSKIDGVSIKRQKWFVQTIRDQGKDPRGIMGNQERLAGVMEAADIDYVLFLKPDGDQFTANLVQKEDAEPILELAVKRTDSGMPESEAEKIRERIASQFEPTGLKEPSFESTEPSTEEVSETEREKPEGQGSEETTGEASTDDEETNKKTATGGIWFWVSGRGRLFKRDFTVAGSQNAVLAYNSRYYPGFEVDLELYPLRPTASSLDAVGLFLDFNQGFESLTVPDEQGNRTSVSITQTEIEGGPILGLGDALSKSKERLASRLRFKTTVRYSNYSVGKNDKLPSTSLTSVILGGMVSHPVLFDGLAAEARLEILPVAFFGNGGALFGASSFTQGFATRIGLMFALSPAIRIVSGYRFRLHHSKFTGRGASAFQDSEAFELVQGVDLGIQYGH